MLDILRGSMANQIAIHPRLSFRNIIVSIYREGILRQHHQVNHPVLFPGVLWRQTKGP